MGLGLDRSRYKTVISYFRKYLNISKQNKLKKISWLFNGLRCQLEEAGSRGRSVVATAAEAGSLLESAGRGDAGLGAACS